MLRSLRWEEKRWRHRAHMAQMDRSRDAELVAGQRGYALKQAAVRARVRESFEELWLQAGPSRGQRAGLMDGHALVAITGLVDQVAAEASEGTVDVTGLDSAFVHTSED